MTFPYSGVADERSGCFAFVNAPIYQDYQRVLESATLVIREGKIDTTLFLCDGDALDMRTNQINHAFIQGRALNLSDREKELYSKYKEKYTEK